MDGSTNVIVSCSDRYENVVLFIEEDSADFQWHELKIIL